MLWNKKRIMPVFLFTLAFVACANLSAQEATPQTECPGYLIVSTPEFEEAVDYFAEWKRMLGFNVQVVMHDDWTPEQVKATVESANSSMSSLDYLLIVGDDDDVPSQKSELVLPHVTDYYYGCIGQSNNQEIKCGRLPVSISAEANTVVNKIIAYEKTPPTADTFYETAIHCAYFQDEDNYSEDLHRFVTTRDGYEDYRFTRTSEDILEYVTEQGKRVKRIYYADPASTPTNWNKEGLSYGHGLPYDLLLEGEFDWNSNSDDIIKAINEGAFYVLHRGHGEEDKWDYPEFCTQDINQLCNGCLTPVVFSINCKTGKFNSGDTPCFAERFLRKADGGCVAVFAATEYTLSPYNDFLALAMFDAIWPKPGIRIEVPAVQAHSFAPQAPVYTLGEILQIGVNRVSEVMNASILSDDCMFTKEAFHCFGDPSMRIYTEKPTAYENVSVTYTPHSVEVDYSGGGTRPRITFYDEQTQTSVSYIENYVAFETDTPEAITVCLSGHNKIPYLNYSSRHTQIETLASKPSSLHDLHDLQGRRLRTEPQHGIFIMEGKKRVIK